MEQWQDKSEESHIKNGHIGTHLDTYCKSPIPLDYFKSRGILIDVSHICEDRQILISDVEKNNIPPHSFVLIHTGRIERFLYGEPKYFADHPQLSHELIDWLLAKEIRFIGLDCSGIRRGDEHRDADIHCEEHGVYVIENLCNLKLIQSPVFTVYTMWLDDPSMTGLKCRVIAEID